MTEIANEFRSPLVVSGLARGASVTAPLLTGLLTFGIFLTLGASYLTSAGCAFALAAIYFSLFSSDRLFPVGWLIVAVAGLQWVLVPALAYMRYGEVGSSPMRVPELEYMLLAVPGVFALAVGIMGFNRSDRRYQHAAVKQIQKNKTIISRVALPLLSLSALGSLGVYFVPGELGFLLYLLAGLKFVVVILLVIAQNKWAKYAIAVVLLAGAADSVAANSFHDVLLWSTVLSIMYWNVNNVSVKIRISVFLLALLLVASLQTVKLEYRADLRARGGSAEISEYVAQTWSRATDIIEGNYDLDVVYNSSLERLNQGALVSLVIVRMSNRELANGDTIKEGLIASFVPRILVPTKATAGGHETFERFTGKKLLNGTSMGVSLLGEAYGNFGGKWIVPFLLAYGFGLAVALRTTEKLFRGKFIGVTILPLIYLHAIKAETDFVTTMNHVAKATLLFVAVVLVIEQQFVRRRHTHDRAQGRALAGNS